MKFILIILSFILSGCYYSDGCMYTPQMVNCVYNDVGKYPDITTYYKVNMTTDKNVRWKDAIACGAVYDKEGWIYKNLKSVGAPDERNTNARREFYLCMENKGYKTRSNYECWKKGICN